AERAGFHLAAHQFAHLVELRRRRRLVFEADDVFADRRRADERGDVRRDAALFEVAEILRERRPGDVVLEVALVGEHALFHPGAERPHGLAFAEDLGRHALPQLALRAAIHDQRLRGPRQHVDEAWGDREIGGINHRRRRGGFQVAYGDDAVAQYADVGAARRPAGAVVDRA